MILTTTAAVIQVYEYSKCKTESDGLEAQNSRDISAYIDQVCYQCV